MSATVPQPPKGSNVDMLTITDIDPNDLASLPAIHTAPVTTTVLGVVTAATYNPAHTAWAVEIIDGSGDGPVLGVDLDGAAIAAAGATAWRTGNIVTVTVEDWAGRGWDVAVQGGTIDDVLALPDGHDPNWPRIIVDVELLTA